jgi:hypothetical protein
VVNHSLCKLPFVYVGNAKNEKGSLDPRSPFDSKHRTFTLPGRYEYPHNYRHWNHEQGVEKQSPHNSPLDVAADTLVVRCESTERFIRQAHRCAVRSGFCFSLHISCRLLFRFSFGFGLCSCSLLIFCQWLRLRKIRWTNLHLVLFLGRCIYAVGRVKVRFPARPLSVGRVRGELF